MLNVIEITPKFRSQLSRLHVGQPTVVLVSSACKYVAKENLKYNWLEFAKSMRMMRKQNL